MAITWSPTRMGAYLTCPAMYRYRYFDKAKETENPMATLGKQFHAIVRRLHSHPTRKFYYLSEDSCVGAWWGYFWKKTETTFQDKNSWYALGSIGEKAVREYYRGQENISSPLAVEENLGKCNIKLEGYRLGGTIDQVRVAKDGSLAIVDLKLSWIDPTTAPWQIWISQNLQLTVYWYALTQITKGRRRFQTEKNGIRIFVHHLHIAREKAGIRIDSRYSETKRGEEDVEDLVDTLYYVSSSVQDGLFPATDNKSVCKYCGYSYLCLQKSAGKTFESLGPDEILEHSERIEEQELTIPAKPKQLRFRFPRI